MTEQDAFSIYRYNPDADAKPRMQDYDIALEPTDRMLLDALVRIKEHDDTFSFRRSCREGVCGSGRDEHQRQEPARVHHQDRRREGAVVIRRCRACRSIRDLVVDMSQFLQAVPLDQAVRAERHAAAEREPAPVARRTARSSTASTSASCARAARPRARRSGGNPTSFVGPGGPLGPYRFIADTRD
jgi:succinate dehydrogenase / fumarate reductase iron-sulfur subunit